MTPKEKAAEVFNLYKSVEWEVLTDEGLYKVSHTENSAKLHAIYHANGILRELTYLKNYWHNDVINPVKYWQSVKTEIEKL